MVDSPEQMKHKIEADTYAREDYDVSTRLRRAIYDNQRAIDVPYFLCDKLKKELKSKGYRVIEKSNWFFGECTRVEW